MERGFNLTADRSIIATLASGLDLLLRAHHYARSSSVDVWQFALEVTELRQAGFTNNEFRLLLVNGYVDHALEITLPGDESRTFRQSGPFSQLSGTCFVLTQTGVHFAGEILDNAAAEPNSHRDTSINRLMDQTSNRARRSSFNGGPQENLWEATPTWDANRKELRLGGQIIKVFKWPASNQELVLTVFEEEGWPARIDDPLPAVENQDPKRRLHDTIKCLNRSQKSPLIHFRGDGTGEGVIWDLAENGNGKRVKPNRR